MTVLSTDVTNKLGEDTLFLLFKVYEELSSKHTFPPNIDLLYDSFREKWIDEIHEFVTVNADSLDINISEVTKDNLTTKLSEWGYPVPSQTKIHQVFYNLGISYVSYRGEMMNGSVIEIW